MASIDPGTVAILKEHRSRQLTERLRAGPLWIGSGRVFTTSTGAPLHPDTPSQLMPKLLQRAGVPPAPLHDLRHLHATTLLRAGVPVHLVAARLGHVDPAITLRVYAHVLPEDGSEVGDVFAQALDRR